jgi:hypothetical protein
VPTCPDADDESDETVNMALTSPVGATLGSQSTAVLTITDNDGPVGGPVTVTATAGTPGPTNYPTLKDAIDAINAGTHQGDITVSIVTSTTETATSFSTRVRALLQPPIHRSLSDRSMTEFRLLVRASSAEDSSSLTVRITSPSTATTRTPAARTVT